jgi:hypothetical protein
MDYRLIIITIVNLSFYRNRFFSLFLRISLEHPYENKHSVHSKSNTLIMSYFYHIVHKLLSNLLFGNCNELCTT